MKEKRKFTRGCIGSLSRLRRIVGIAQKAKKPIELFVVSNRGELHKIYLVRHSCLYQHYLMHGTTGGSIYLGRCNFRDNNTSENYLAVSTIGINLFLNYWDAYAHQRKMLEKVNGLGKAV